MGLGYEKRLKAKIDKLQVQLNAAEGENMKLNIILFHRENGLAHPDLQGEIEKSKMAEKLKAAEGEIEALATLNKLLEGDLVIMQSEFVADACTCTEKDGGKILDSCAISSRADAMRFLAERGKIIIEKEYGRRVIGKWAEQAPKESHDN